MRLIFLVFCGIMYVGRIKTDHTDERKVNTHETILQSMSGLRRTP